MRTSRLRPHHERLGATFGELAGAEVVRGYAADSGSEYRAVREGAGIVERTDLGVIRMWGRDPVKMLNGLITNDLAASNGTRAVYGAMLTPKGRVITDLRAHVQPDEGAVEVLFDYPVLAEAPLSEHLRKYMPPLFARWEPLESLTVIGIYGPQAAAVVSTLTGASGDFEEDGLVVGRFQGERVTGVMTRFAGGEKGFDLYLPEALVADFWEGATDGDGNGELATPLGMAALETLRIEAGRPRFGRELTETSIPAEAYETSGLLPRAISFTKGCYTGQEVVVRIAHRGHVNRHLRGITLGEAPSPAEGTPLVREDDGKEVGQVTSATHSPRVGETVALGYLRREIAPGDSVRIGGEGGPPARVVELPFDPAH